MSRIEAVVSDFGGVLTAPLLPAFIRWQDSSGIPVEALGEAMARVKAASGAHPLYELERGRLSEADFLATLERALSDLLDREVQLESFGEQLMGALSPNQELFDYYRSLREKRGLRLAILTNNVREWEQLWRAKLPIDEIFETVVDSAFVGMRKPEPEIYELMLDRLGLAASACAFVDDLEPNVEAALELGFRAIRFRDTAQAIGELEALLV